MVFPKTQFSEKKVRKIVENSLQIILKANQMILVTLSHFDSIRVDYTEFVALLIPKTSKYHKARICLVDYLNECEKYMPLKKNGVEFHFELCVFFFC